MDIREEKQQIRHAMLARRRALSEEEWREGSDVIKERVLALPEVAAARRVLTYVSFKDKEVDTLGIIETLLARGCVVGVPRSLREGVIEWRRLEDIGQLAPARFGLMEPDPNRTGMFEAPETADVCLVPGIAWDDGGNRIGYGLGFFDRFLINFRGYTIGLGLTCQIEKRIPREEHDVSVMLLITN